MAIDAGMVKALREKTGLPMMECKSALQEADGDEQQAIELLRKKGLAKAAKRAGRATGQGRIAVHQDPDSGRMAIVETLCETEPVAGTEDFIKLSTAAAQAATKLENPTPEAILKQPMPDNPAQTVGDFVDDVVNRIRENIKIGRVGVVSGNVGKYLHHDLRKGVLIEFSGPVPEDVAAGVCMHVVSMRPPYIRREDVPANEVEEERARARESVQGKPENIIDKIVSGKIDKWFSEFVLLEQPFVMDDKKTVSEFLRGHGSDLTVNRCLRLEIGEE